MGASMPGSLGLIMSLSSVSPALHWGHVASTKCRVKTSLPRSTCSTAISWQRLSGLIMPLAVHCHSRVAARSRSSGCQYRFAEFGPQLVFLPSTFLVNPKGYNQR